VSLPLFVCLLVRVCLSVCCKVSSADGAHQVGKISKQWGGFVKEYYTNADNFGVSCMLQLIIVSSCHLSFSLSVSISLSLSVFLFI